MAEDVGMFRVLASTTQRGYEFHGYWHISIVNADGSTNPFEDRPIEGSFPTEEQARHAAMKAGLERAQELDARNRAEPFGED